MAVIDGRDSLQEGETLVHPDLSDPDTAKKYFETYNMKPTFRFKYDDAGEDPITGRKLYTGVMLVESPTGETISSYKAGMHTNRQKLQDDLNRMMATVTSSFSKKPTSVKQNYGSQTVNIAPSEAVAQTVMSGGSLSAPSTYETQQVNPDGTITRQLVNQQGIRQAAPFTTYAANMLDPNYNAALDAIVDPSTGLPVYQTPTGPVSGGLGSLPVTPPQDTSVVPVTTPLNTIVPGVYTPTNPYTLTPLNPYQTGIGSVQDSTNYFLPT